MVQRHRGDDARERALDHIRRVEAAAQPHFEQQRVGGMASEQQKGGGGLDFEDGDRRCAVPALAEFERLGELAVADQHAAAGAAEPEALIDAHEIGRGVDVHALAGGLEHRAHERNRRAFAVRPGDMDDRRQSILGIVERGEHAPHAIEREIDASRMKCEKPGENRPDRRRRQCGHLRTFTCEFLCGGRLTPVPSRPAPRRPAARRASAASW